LFILFSMLKSAGILMYRNSPAGPEYFLVHPGGPFWKNKDTGAWSIPKGEFVDGEDPLKAAQREFEEETGKPVSGTFIELKPVKQKSGKMIYTWAVEGDLDHLVIQSNTFPLEWPPRSGKYIDVPEVDKAGWFSYEEAREKLIPGQGPILDELRDFLMGKGQR
jgi:predicted NUDIX family NTP pyrophosphohydrolase